MTEANNASYERISIYPMEFTVGLWKYTLVKSVELKHMLGPISEDRRKQRKVGTKIEHEEKKFFYQYISLGL